jgi:hypothetical protein
MLLVVMAVSGSFVDQRLRKPFFIFFIWGPERLVEYIEYPI